MNQEQVELDHFIHAKTLVLHPDFKAKGHGAKLRDPSSCLEEAIGLCHAIELDIQHSEIIPIRAAVPATLFGKGTVERLKGLAAGLEIELIIINAELTPLQQRNLEKNWKVKVIDRTGLILEIFGARAQTAEGRLQVELASLTYQRSRLVRSWTHLERQRGGLGFIGGPGETQIEVDRRLIDERITKLKRELKKVTQTRSLHRKSRKKVPYPIVALVGYTNAGKSTLFNKLTHADVMAKDILFATLDPTMRQLELPQGTKIILSDTVGFISDLPTQLVAAFRATLEEVCEADLLLHVQDISQEEADLQREDVIKILQELDLQDKINEDTFDVLNKIDLIENEDIPTSEMHYPISAITGKGLEALLTGIEEHLSKKDLIKTIHLPYTAGKELAWLYEHAQVLERKDTEENIEITVKIKRKFASQLEKLG